MAHFLRGKQAGIQSDLSAGLSPESFLLDEVARYGINSRISAIAYDPVQSLLAAGTSETQFGSGEIYVFGQERVSAVFSLPRKASTSILQFCGDKLIAVAKNELCVFSLDERKLVASYAPPGHVTCVLTDPVLDYAFIGLQNGELVTYDLDRHLVALFKVPNLWKERNPRARFLPIVSLAFHPKDIGTLLIGYSDGAVIFSIKQNIPIKFFQYEVPKGAPGGDSDPSSARETRWPKIVKALWHPTATFVLTVHEDSSLVFWDPKDGRVVMARTIQAVDVNKPGDSTPISGAVPGTFSIKAPVFEIAWCCKENPDDTGLLIAGGTPTTDVAKGLTFIDLGVTPNYQTSTWQILSGHFASLKRQSTLQTPPNAEVVHFCLIPRASPHFGGAQDPIAVVALLSSGELVTLSFPSGYPISPTNVLHPSLTMVHPFVTKLELSCVDRTRWLGWREKRAQGPPLLIGGAASKKALKRFENRDIAVIAHADGLLRLWDTGHDDEIENPSVLQVDLARAVGRYDRIEVTQMSLSGAAGELAVGLRSGELAIFKWGRNENPGRDAPLGDNDGPGEMTSISHRADPGLKEGFLPLLLLDQRQGPVTVIKHSDVGFICVGYQSGSIAIIDLRGPAVIYSAHSTDFAKQSRRSSWKSHSSAEKGTDWATCVEFGVLTIEDDNYSSISCFVGTNHGHLATFKILPSSSPTYTVSFVGSCTLDDRVLSICPTNAETGAQALATQEAVSNLRKGERVNGVIIAVTPSGCRMFKPATSKGAHKSWDDFMCDSATVVNSPRGYSLVGLFGDGKVRAYSIPSLKEIGSANISKLLDTRRLGDARISPSGDILAWNGPSEMMMLHVWGAGSPLLRTADRLFNPQVTPPPRPTISNLQWIAGTQFVSTADVDLLGGVLSACVGGPNRPPSKRMIEQMRQEEQERQKAEREGRLPRSNTNTSQGSQETYWAYMQRQVQERTENLNIMGDSMDRLGESSSGLANDVNKFVKNQKKKAVLGALGSKFGF
ncbi:lethal(2) giant larvae protein [Arthroderma uncinatum]|uniref:lethal(2) giant larvae protein n=1 Tax=Arthroderma uncinatum TaxID=74035 RepID=UPI00144AE772|nr:lethal(2) giant larvae protein [Arthroderma uncinatum]KAF3491572.1 lethal(2) giant larvae protein [Arthroderma uncinatum]